MDLNFEKLPRFKNDAMKIWQLIPQWAHAHQVDQGAVINQIYIAHAWLDSNPKKAPKKLITRFLWSWMGQAKRYGNLKTPQKAVPKVIEAHNEDMSVEEMEEIRRRNFPGRGMLRTEAA